jgi:3-isopropylmalate/(R)-2-methylmalate dehydratase large subunit
MQKPRTLFENIWDAHIVAQEPDAPAILYVDLHLVHEVTSPQAFTALRERRLTVRRPDRTLATMDHSTPTTDLSLPLFDDMAARQLRQLQANCQEFGIPLYDLESPQRGIVHVIGPELGLTRPGMTIVCGDSHTATHGAFGALAFGIGTSEVAHVLATQCLLQYKPKTFQVNFEGHLPASVTAKDMILALIASIGIGGATGHVLEYAGPAVRSLSMEARMTLCNMSIEAGARAGMIAPDDVTFEYLSGRPSSPPLPSGAGASAPPLLRGAGGDSWRDSLAYWQTLPSDPGATFDRTLSLDVSNLEPMITYGTNPGMGIPISHAIPDPDGEPDSTRRAALEKALRYMDLRPGTRLLDHPIDVVFIGSCTNSRLPDLRQAAELLRGRKVAPGVRLLVVPGSEEVRRQAEGEGLDQVFRAAGGEWRYAGCSMCIAMNGDQLQPGQYAVSTSNRNFEGRQGPGGRTFLASPLTAAASAIMGKVTDPRRMMD